MFKRLLKGWPLAQQLLHGLDGTGLEARSARTRALSPKNHGAASTRSVCPYCAVGCGQLVYHRDGKLVSIEGDPESLVEERDGQSLMQTTAMAHLGGATLKERPPVAQRHRPRVGEMRAVFGGHQLNESEPHRRRCLRDASN